MVLLTGARATLKMAGSGEVFFDGSAQHLARLEEHCLTCYGEIFLGERRAWILQIGLSLFEEVWLFRL